MRVVDGRPEYRGVIDVLSKIVKQQGFYSLWRGKSSLGGVVASLGFPRDLSTG